jgi:hypothetical protein
MAQRLARGAHNPEVTGSNPVSGIYHSAGLQEPVHAVSTATLFADMAQRLARGAHNSEDLGSKPSVGIFFNRGARRAEGSEGALVAPSSFPRIPLISRFPLPLDGVYRKGYIQYRSRQMAGL